MEPNNYILLVQRKLDKALQVFLIKAVSFTDAETTFFNSYANDHYSILQISVGA